MSDKLEVRGVEPIRRGEGLTWRIDVSRYGTGVPVPDDIEIVRVSDGTDVTDIFTITSTPTVNSDNEIVLPEVTVPTDAALGLYRLTFPFSVGGFSPARPYLQFIVRS